MAPGTSTSQISNCCQVVSRTDPPFPTASSVHSGGQRERPGACGPAALVTRMASVKQAASARPALSGEPWTLQGSRICLYHLGPWTEAPGLSLCPGGLFLRVGRQLPAQSPSEPPDPGRAPSLGSPNIWGCPGQGVSREAALGAIREGLSEEVS